MDAVPVIMEWPHSTFFL